MIKYGFHLWRTVPKTLFATRDEAHAVAMDWIAGLQAKYPGLVYKFRPDPDYPEDEIIDAYYGNRTWRAFVDSYAETGED